MVGQIKSANSISAIGLRPLIADPKAIPAMEDSASGVSMTLSSPNSDKNPIMKVAKIAGSPDPESPDSLEQDLRKTWGGGRKP